MPREYKRRSHDRLDGLKPRAETLAQDMEKLLDRLLRVSEAISCGRLIAARTMLAGPEHTQGRGIKTDLNKLAAAVCKLDLEMAMAGVKRQDLRDRFKSDEVQEAASRDVGTIDYAFNTTPQTAPVPVQPAKPHRKGATGQSRSSVAKTKAAIKAKARKARVEA